MSQPSLYQHIAGVDGLDLGSFGVCPRVADAKKRVNDIALPSIDVLQEDSRLFVAGNRRASSVHSGTEAARV
jgi:hypothetical protein